MNKSIIICLCVFFALSVKAQNNNSPYSIIGIGDIESSSFDRTSGMGNTGVALWGTRSIYQDNPGSYARLKNDTLNGVPTTSFIIEIGARYNGVTYSGNPITNSTDNNSSDLQFKKIVFAIKLRPKWAFSLGLLPYSSNNYSFFQTQQIVGGSVPSYVQGSGNTSQFYIANSFAVNKHLSFGIHTALIFGQFGQVQTISAVNQSDSVLTTNTNYSVHAPYIKFGVQYNTDITSKLNVAAGATMALQSKLNGLYDLSVLNGNSTIKTEDTTVNNYFTIPVSYKGGLAATYAQKYTFAADYSFQPWGNLNQKDPGSNLGYKLVNSQRFSIGGQYSNKVTFPNKVVFEKYFLQGGFYYNNSYLEVNGTQINDVGGSIGAGFNTLKGLGISGALTIGSRGTTNMNLVKENYTRFNITISYHDFWLTAKKKYL